MILLRIVNSRAAVLIIAYSQSFFRAATIACSRPGAISELLYSRAAWKRGNRPEALNRHISTLLYVII